MEVRGQDEDGDPIKVVFNESQLARLRELAEERDVQRERSSRFSLDEQQELDDAAVGVADVASQRAEELAIASESKASNRGFNARQEADLTHRFRRRLLPLIGYLVLALSTAYAIGEARHAAEKAAAQTKAAAIAHSNQNRKQATSITKRVTLSNCKAGNDLRFVLRGILTERLPSVVADVKHRSISPAQGAAELSLLRHDVSKLHARDCNALVAQIH